MSKDLVLEKTLAELNKKHGEGTVMRLGDIGGATTVPRFTSGIASLDLALGGGWPWGRMIEVYGPESSGKCLTEDTNILTPNGYKTIKEIFNEEGLSTQNDKKDVEVRYPLINANGDIEYTTHFVFNGKNPIKKIKTKTGTEIKCTDLHPLCVIDKHGIIIWKYSKDIEAGDFLVGRKGDKYYSSDSLVNEEEAIVLGMLIANASFEEDKISIVNNTSEAQDELLESIYKIKEFSDAQIDKYHTSSCLKIEINDKESISKFYERTGIKNWSEKDKNVPPIILKSDFLTQKAFLKGYFNYKCKLDLDSSKLVIESQSISLLKTLQLMLKNSGILSSLNDSAYELSINSSYNSKFLNKFDTTSIPKDFINGKAYLEEEKIPNIENLVYSYYCGLIDSDKTSKLNDWIDEIKSNKSSVSIDKLKYMLSINNNSQLLKINNYLVLHDLLKIYTDEHLYFDEVVSIEDMDSMPTFDFSMQQTHTFIAEGIINHNTSVALFALAEVQKIGKEVAFIDLENALDPVLAQMYGVDTDRLILSYPMTGEAAFEVVEGLSMTGKVGAIVMDSVSAIIPNAEREEDVGKSLPAIQARLMSQVLRRLVGVCGKTGTTVFFVNQIREKVGVLYGCLHADTLVNFADGRSLSIKEVVEKKIAGKVWSFNEETKQYEPKEIIDWHYNGQVETENDFIHIQTESINNNENFEFTVTPDHLVLTDSGWVKAKNLNKSSMIASKYTSIINDSLGDFLWGSFAGGSQVSVKDKNIANYNLQDTHGEEYLQWKANKIRKAVPVKENKSHFDYELAKIKEQIGDNRSLKFLKNHYSPMGLAIWYMNDGCLDEKDDHYEATLNIKNFSDAMILNDIVKAFKERGFDVNKQNSLGAIIFNKEAANLLFETIAEFIPNCMQHKLPKQYQGRYQDFELSCTPIVIQDFVKVKEIRNANENQMKNKGKYDISIADNHNYIVGGINNGIVVHNSPEITSGGRALSFYASQRVNIRIDSFLGEGMKIQNSREGAIGHKTNIQIVKNKIAVPFKRASFMLKYGEGFDKYYDLATIAEYLGIVNKAGSWFNYGEHKWHGQANFIDAMKEDTNLFNQIKDEINIKIANKDQSIGEE